MTAASVRPSPGRRRRRRRRGLWVWSPHPLSTVVVVVAQWRRWVEFMSWCLREFTLHSVSPQSMAVVVVTTAPRLDSDP